LRRNGEEVLTRGVVSTEAGSGPNGNVGEERHSVVVAVGSRFKEELGDGRELIDVEAGPDGGRTWLSTGRLLTLIKCRIHARTCRVNV
jgi:hypothetical protein